MGTLRIWKRRLARGTWGVASATLPFAIALTLACSNTPSAPPASTAAVDPAPESHGDGMLGQVSKADQDSGRSQKPYVKNMRLVGQQDVRNRGNNGNLSWMGDCAYVGAYYGGTDPLTGLAVIDAANPQNPELIKILPGAPGTRSPQTEVHEGRKILAVMPYAIENGPYGDPPGPTQILFYDVSQDCKNPVPLGVYDYGKVVTHEFIFSPDGMTVYATVNRSGDPNSPPQPGNALMVIDVSDPTKPKALTTWDLSQEPGKPESGCHDLDINDEGTRAYASVRWFQDGVQHKGLTILDISEVTAKRPNPKIRRISTMNWGPPQHGHSHTTVGPLTIDGRLFTIQLDEGQGADGAEPRGWGRIIDVTNERYPLQVSTIQLPISLMKNAAITKLDNADYATHFVTIDDRHNARLAFISWYSSGLRVWDISNPWDPQEIAYYIPGARPNPVLKVHTRYPNTKVDYVYGYPRYRPETGQVWFSSLYNGLMILELDETLRRATTPSTH